MYYCLDSICAHLGLDFEPYFTGKKSHVIVEMYSLSFWRLLLANFQLNSCTMDDPYVETAVPREFLLYCFGCSPAFSDLKSIKFDVFKSNMKWIALLSTQLIFSQHH